MHGARPSRSVGAPVSPCKGRRWGALLAISNYRHYHKKQAQVLHWAVAHLCCRLPCVAQVVHRPGCTRFCSGWKQPCSCRLAHQTQLRSRRQTELPSSTLHSRSWQRSGCAGWLLAPKFLKSP